MILSTHAPIVIIHDAMDAKLLLPIQNQLQLALMSLMLVTLVNWIGQ